MLCETNPRVNDLCIASPPNVADWAGASRTLESAGVARSESFIARLEPARRVCAAPSRRPGSSVFCASGPRSAVCIEDKDMSRGTNTWRSSATRSGVERSTVT